MARQAPLRTGIAGCGYQGQWLARAAAEVPELQVVACADPDVYAAQQAAAYAPDATVYAAPEEMIRQEGVDAVFVATPHHLLQPIALLAVQAGKHVLAEKPIALNAGEAADLEAAVEQSGVTFMSGYSFRYFQEPWQAHQLLTAGAIGEIVAVSAGIGRSFLNRTWVADPKAGGGPMLFLGSHIVDQLLWTVADRPVEVFADVRHHAETGTDATSAFQVRFARGAVAQCLVTDTVGSWFHDCYILGRSGSVQLSSRAPGQYSLTVQSQTLPDYAEPKTFCSRLDRESAILGKLKAELGEFARSVKEGKPPLITVRDGRNVLAVIDAVFESGRTGRPVTPGMAVAVA